MRWLGSRCAGSAVHVDPHSSNEEVLELGSPSHPGRANRRGPGSVLGSAKLHCAPATPEKSARKQIALALRNREFQTSGRVEGGHSCPIFAARRPNDLFETSAVQLVDSRPLISGARPDQGALGFAQRHASGKPCTELPYRFDARFWHQAAYRPSCSRRAMPIPASASSTGRRLAARLPWKARATSWGASGVPALTSTC